MALGLVTRRIEAAGARPCPAQRLLNQLLTEQRPSLFGHHQRVSAMAAMLARRLGLGEAEAREIGRAGSLHDIGMTLLSPNLVDQHGLLSHNEKELVHQHSALGCEILALAEDPNLRLAARVALEHHERWDGSGYPYGLKGEEICLAARIVAVCAVYDALRNPRPGKAPLGHLAALAVLTDGDDQSGPAAFDPEVRAVFVWYGEEFRRIADGPRPLAEAA